MTIKQFIEKAIEGGWEAKLHEALPNTTVEYGWKVVFHEYESYHSMGAKYEMEISRVLLDPLAWQAVGKVEGWKWEDGPTASIMGDTSPARPYFQAAMDAIWGEKTIEHFLETL